MADFEDYDRIESDEEPTQARQQRVAFKEKRPFQLSSRPHSERSPGERAPKAARGLLNESPQKSKSSSATSPTRPPSSSSASSTAVTPASSKEADKKEARREVERERQRLVQLESDSDSANQELFALFREVQCAVHELSLPDFRNPEIVVVGMQSDGKSSFIEALLGFQFNVVHSTIGTRRPLVIQMTNDPAAKSPQCVFRKEGARPVGDGRHRRTTSDDQQGSSSSSDTDTSDEQRKRLVVGVDDDDGGWESERVPVRQLSAELSRRTAAVAGVDKDGVSAEPMILAVRFAHCANLTIIDTPGFRIGGNSKLSSDIDKMVTQQIRPSHRIIVCLEQSSVEWANSLSRPLVQRVDPELKRTILVVSKMDNRLKEFHEEADARDYFTSLNEYLPGGARKPPVFFVSLPTRRDFDEGEYKEALRKVYLADYKKLVQLGLHRDEALVNAFGVVRAKKYLELTLTAAYKKNLKPTLRLLSEMAARTGLRIEQLSQELSQKEPPIDSLRERAVAYVEVFANMLVRLLQGSIQGDPDKWGQTLEEEEDAWRHDESGLAVAAFAATRAASAGLTVPNAELKIYGGAQYYRVVEEFALLVQSLGASFGDQVSASQVASALGYGAPTAFNLERAACDIVQCRASQVLKPLVEVMISRVAYTVKRLLPIATECIDETGELGIYPKFMQTLASHFDAIVDHVIQVFREKAEDDLHALVTLVDSQTIRTLNQGLLPDTATSPTTTDAAAAAADEDRPVGLTATHRRVCELARQLFLGVRFLFSHVVRAKLNGFFLMPLITRLNSGEIAQAFRTGTDDQLRQLFHLDTREIRKQLDALKSQNARTTQQFRRFQHLYSKFD